MPDDQQAEDMLRQHERIVHGCTCPAERVTDPDRIAAVGGTEASFVFHHADDCNMTRIHRSPYN
jgi:hypothetical protein